MKRPLAIALCGLLAVLSLTACSAMPRHRAVNTPLPGTTLFPDSGTATPGSRMLTPTAPPPHTSVSPRSGVTPGGTAPIQDGTPDIGTLPYTDTAPRNGLQSNGDMNRNDDRTVPRSGVTPNTSPR